MDTQGFKTILSKRFTDEIQVIKPDIFKVISKYHDKNIAAHYFDCTKSFLKEDFDLNGYQRELLADDYYGTSGPLQWNYYLYFLSDMEDFSIEKKAEIESDKSFSRKLVATQEEIIRLIEVQDKLKNQSKPIKSDALLTIWRGKLKGVGLSSVYLIKDYPKPNDVYQQFVNNTPVPESEESVVPLATDTKVAFIEKLEFNSFRSFKKRDFPFKKVNLIRGVNGAGKTSLLEAIELCLCGQTIENSKEEKAEQLKISFVDQRTDLYTPSDNKKFQARDSAWYGNNVMRGNELSQSYHIYNFFDSEAAFRFSNESNSGDKIQEIFARIILGEETNIVFDRINRLYEKLNSDAKRMSQEIIDCEEQIRNFQSKIQEFDSSAISINTLGEIIKSLDAIGWTGVNLLLSEGANRKIFNDELFSVINFVDNSYVLFQDRLFSIDLVKSDLEKVEQTLTKYNDYLSSSRRAVEELTRIRKEKQSDESQLSVVRKSARYYVESDINLIKGLDQKILQSTRMSQRLNEIIDLIKEVKLANNIAFRDALESERESATVQQVNLDALRKQLSGLEESIGMLNKLKSDLKRVGLEYIRFTKIDDECPLCHTHFDNRNLLEKIESVESGLEEEGILEQLYAQVKEAEQKLRETNANVSLLQRITDNISSGVSLPIAGFEALLISDISGKLSGIVADQVNDAARLTDLNKRFKLNNLTEIEFNEINRNLKHVGIDLALGLSISAEFTSLESKLQSDLDRKINEELIINSRQSELIEEMTKTVNTYFDSIVVTSANIAEIINRINDEKGKLEALNNTIDTTNRLLQLSRFNNLAELKSDLAKIKDLFHRYLEVESNNKLRKEYNDQIIGQNSKVTELKQKIERYSSAVTVLSDVINVNNPSNFIKQFFNDNKQSILDIFRTIHLPNEFDDIHFESADVIKLKEKNSNNLRALTEVSTGQKSAFILSLYLTLNNNLQNGPPLMIFDDPVAYVDDINTLSFLDFLRDRILEQDRQLFFATANSKLANLFQQKFDFLGDDLQIIKLNKVIPA